MLMRQFIIKTCYKGRQYNVTENDKTFPKVNSIFIMAGKHALAKKPFIFDTLRFNIKIKLNRYAV